MAPVVAPPPKPIRKKLVRRAGPDRSQTLRRAVQLAFFALNAWIGIECYLFVCYYATGGRAYGRVRGKSERNGGKRRPTLRRKSRPRPVHLRSRVGPLDEHHRRTAFEERHRAGGRRGVCLRGNR